MGLGDLAKMLGQMKNLRANVEQFRQQMETKSVSASSGGGMVTATVNGLSELKSLKIDPAVFQTGDTEMLEDLIVAAVNAAVGQSREEMKQNASSLTGGADFPNLDKMLENLGPMMQ